MKKNDWTFQRYILLMLNVYEETITLIQKTKFLGISMKITIWKYILFKGLLNDIQRGFSDTFELKKYLNDGEWAQKRILWMLETHAVCIACISIRGWYNQTVYASNTNIKIKKSWKLMIAISRPIDYEVCS